MKKISSESKHQDSEKKQLAKKLFFSRREGKGLGKGLTVKGVHVASFPSFMLLML